MPEVVATSIAGYFSILTFLAIFKSGIDHAGFILILDAVCFTFWFALLTRKNIRRRRALERAREGNILSYFLIFVLVLYLGDVCWNKGYLNLFAVDTLFSGNSHIDTMYDATIAEAIKNYHIPSILLNRIHYLHYNYGSHALIALIALVLNLPALTVYNYLFPVVFCPIFFYILLCLALQLKRMNKADPSLSSFDLVILLVGLVGIFPPSFLAKMGIFSSALFDE